jgi:hypothetical protein
MPIIIGNVPIQADPLSVAETWSSDSDATVRIAFSLEALPSWSKRDGDLGEIGF